MTSVVWFRSDLRVDDNSALNAALEIGEPVIGVFLLADGQWRTHHWGPRKQLFVWQHVLALRTALAARGIALHIEHAPRLDDAPGALAAFVLHHNARRVLANAEYGVDEGARDRRVAVRLAAHRVKLRVLHDFTLLAPGSVLTRQGAPFRVFSPFRRAWLDVVRGAAIPCFPAPPLRTPIEPPPVPPWNPPPGSLDRDWWPIGENRARQRLEDFVAHRIERYHEDRDVPALDGSSRLSPYLASGVLSVRRCMQAALAANHGEWDSGQRGVQTWLGELVWREFYTHILVAFPRVSRNQPFRADTNGVPWRGAGLALDQWQRGRTGFPLVDAGMRQLLARGWMHNRLRMLCAMFLSKYLLIDWRIGERWFMDQLVDGELAANNGGWQWSASTGTDAAPYFRVLSPVRQAERFDREGEFVRRYVPELAGVTTAALLEPGHPELLATGYPAPIIDTRIAREQVLQAFRALGVAALSAP
ncbi:MAG: deoxyribodipyrimidine photo-lyase [Gammaproteobacteria bacterium]|nr:deoxyribodipyrimidine photo-lyase [Gammaproteobacteria bacterium]MBK7521009.1 deoxyribodipyrimidine photo-lyase [Gammaproteobacteria bacterium]MBK7728787.1 deoxyribodipyrimidine photo-lyase [Gammaproteobacteria bacterium]MBK8306701.1 deoxyribodipyrimidine photo-lyase [Gammaproteobacteria bacterium]